MSDLPVMGSADKPVRLDPYQRIIEVGWSVGFIAVVQLDYNENSSKSVAGVVPADAEVVDLVATAGQVIPRDDYKTKQIVRLNRIDLGEELIFPAYTSKVGVASVSSGGGIDYPVYVDSKAAMTAEMGRPPDKETANGIFVEVLTPLTGPGGASISYISDYVETTFIPPDFDFTGWATALWIDTIDHDPEFMDTVRRSFLVNFSNKPRDPPTAPPEQYVTTAAVTSTPGGLAFDSAFSVKIYPFSADLTFNADGTVSASRPAVVSQSGTASNEASGIVQKFDRTGFVS